MASRGRSLMLRRLEKALQRAGFATLNLDYESRKKPLDAARRWTSIPPSPRSRRASAGPIHFVTHSMGGLLARVYIARYRPARLGRVVMLGTPNGGSEIADRLKDVALYRAFFGPAGLQLLDHRATPHWRRCRRWTTRSASSPATASSIRSRRCCCPGRMTDACRWQSSQAGRHDRPHDGQGLAYGPAAASHVRQADHRVPARGPLRARPSAMVERARRASGGGLTQVFVARCRYPAAISPRISAGRQGHDRQHQRDPRQARPSATGSPSTGPTSATRSMAMSSPASPEAIARRMRMPMCA